jgi:hypothetical protein
MSEHPTIHGELGSGFGPVADAFRRNFDQHDDMRSRNLREALLRCNA